MSDVVIVGEHVVNLAGIAGCHWERNRTVLFVHFIGGRFVSFKGDEAQRLFRAISEAAKEIPASESSSD